ncbi:uncharacterized protein LOC134817786 [Bolinopsis microptera]|uniref:uncharacterized protein LOC134817786 n=1 Tax=Bolinopsis microptera TaxID=2820187 RepID=UPI00307ABC6F
MMMKFVAVFLLVAVSYGQECTDNVGTEFCEGYLALGGKCDKYMTPSCQKTCGDCPLAAPCLDTLEALSPGTCGGFVAMYQGNCKGNSNSKYLLEQCAKTCGVC